MKLVVHNWGLNVGDIQIGDVSGSSVFLIGDNELMTLNSFFDTPPESYTIGNIVPLAGV